MWDLIIKGGPVMVPIIAGSIIGLAIVVERLLAFREISTVNIYEFVQEIFRDLKLKKIDSAIELCDENTRHPVAAVFKVGIERRLTPAARLEKILEQSGNNQVEKMEKFLGALPRLYP